MQQNLLNEWGHVSCRMEGIPLMALVRFAIDKAPPTARELSEKTFELATLSDKLS
ncbi:hypothetical protein [Paenibacillus albus]|uniref:hypothetical protein n=1 Tax=Paenibacillus albus TaxID=2495582 RepID=UPI0013DF0B27|nr:hypothetical protein [Paenibacillus albus]